MPRNTQKDIRAEAMRRERILMAGLRLFSQQGIERVSMNMVAQAAGVGPTTLFKYYKSKENLVVAISAMAWAEEWRLALEHYGPEMQETMTAYELIQCYTDWIILVYRRNPALLRFSGDYKSYICRQNPPQEELQEHLEALQPIKVLFHRAYLRARDDGSIRLDVPEDTLYAATAIHMLSVAERFAQGIVWTRYGAENYLRELDIAQDMILSWCAGEKAPPRRPPISRHGS